jgi:hypothetical protein
MYCTNDKFSPIKKGFLNPSLMGLISIVSDLGYIMWYILHFVTQNIHLFSLDFFTALYLFIPIMRGIGIYSTTNGVAFLLRIYKYQFFK